MKNIEETKTYIGFMMTDLRGNWGFGYKDRMEDVREELLLLREMSNSAKEQLQAIEDIKLIDEEIQDGEYDGRVFRDCANFYAYKTSEGFTEQVRNELKDMMSYPENLPEEVA